jgi:hypothetical protein
VALIATSEDIVSSRREEQRVRSPLSNQRQEFTRSDYLGKSIAPVLS